MACENGGRRRNEAGMERVDRSIMNEIKDVVFLNNCERKT
jgi:hypothetical protein